MDLGSVVNPLQEVVGVVFRLHDHQVLAANLLQRFQDPRLVLIARLHATPGFEIDRLGKRQVELFKSNTHPENRQHDQRRREHKLQSDRAAVPPNTMQPAHALHQDGKNSGRGRRGVMRQADELPLVFTNGFPEPASASPMSPPERGEISLGLRTTVQPAASSSKRIRLLRHTAPSITNGIESAGPK